MAFTRLLASLAAALRCWCWPRAAAAVARATFTLEPTPPRWRASRMLSCCFPTRRCSRTVRCKPTRLPTRRPTTPPSIRTTPRTRLTKWKAANGFDTGTGTQVTAVFGDSRDLGFGRRMTARQNPDGTLAFFVENYLVKTGACVRLFADQPRGRDRARPEVACLSRRCRVQPRSGGRRELREILQLQRRDRRAGDHGGHRWPRRQGDARTLHHLPRRQGRCTDATRRLGQARASTCCRMRCRGLAATPWGSCRRSRSTPSSSRRRLATRGRSRKPILKTMNQMGPVFVPAGRAVDVSGRRLPTQGELRRVARHCRRARQGVLRRRRPAQRRLTRTSACRLRGPRRDRPRSTRR